jgi:hypothetical protein
LSHFISGSPKSLFSKSWPCYKLGYDNAFICPRLRIIKIYRLNGLFTLALQPGSNCYRCKEILILKNVGFTCNRSAVYGIKLHGVLSREIYIIAGIYCCACSTLLQGRRVCYLPGVVYCFVERVYGCVYFLPLLRSRGFVVEAPLYNKVCYNCHTAAGWLDFRLCADTYCIGVCTLGTWLCNLWFLSKVGYVLVIITL